MPLFQVAEKLKIPTTLLRDKYLVPPFSILDTSVNEWLYRRNKWENIINNRANNIRNVQVAKHNTPYRNAMNYDEGYKGLERNGSSSTFDPFLCEILIKWFSLPGHTVYDPFAGGHIRGVMSAVLERNYIGVDINPMQVNANEINKEIIWSQYDSNDFGNIQWLLGDSADTTVTDAVADSSCNLLLTCPPYYDLEIYTTDEHDLSNMKTYDEFLTAYRQAIKTGYEKLEADSFAVIVVEEIRDKKTGLFRGFVPDTIRAFCDCGFSYYNELIMENRIMSLGVRCPKYFEQSRKIGKHHQNILVFFKGDTKHIESKYGKFTEGKLFE